jgi:hypothetical protein
MILLDFMFYYFNYWFDQRRYLLSWSSSKERASYALGLASMAVLAALAELLAYTVLKHTRFGSASYLLVLVGLGLVAVYDFIYIKKGRCDAINPASRFSVVKNVSEVNRAKIAIAIFALCFLSPLIVLMIFVPFGDQKLGH